MRPPKLSPEKGAFLARCLEVRRLLTNKALSEHFGICPTSFSTYRVPRETQRFAAKLSAADLDELAAQLSKTEISEPGVPAHDYRP